MDEIVAFGELMLSLSPDGFRRIVQADRLNVFYTGAEANVLAGITALGGKTQLVTRLPENSVGEAALGAMRRYGVGTEHIITGGGRIGVIFNEKGFDARPSAVIYDRKHTAFSELRPGMLDWERILRGAKWFHFGGTAPALGEYLPEVTAEAVETAKKLGIPVSCDLNYRKNLWSRENAKKTMEKLLGYVDILIANEEDAADVLGIRAADSDVISGKLSREGYVDVARQISEKYGIGKVAITLRKSISASDNDWSALLYDGGVPYFSKEYHIHIVDRVGGGDSFAAGLIYAVGNGFPPKECVEFAAAASCLKQTIELDVNLSKPSDIRRLMNGDGSGRVQR